MLVQIGKRGSRKRIRIKNMSRKERLAVVKVSRVVILICYFLLNKTIGLFYDY